MRAVHSYAPRAGIVWRSTPMGHLSFARNARARPLLAPEPDVRTPINAWAWDEVVSQNADVEALFAGVMSDVVSMQGLDASTLGVLFLDVVPMTVLRADYHRDALHYWVPGPADHWLMLLQTALLAATEHGPGP